MFLITFPDIVEFALEYSDGVCVDLFLSDLNLETSVDVIDETLHLGGDVEGCADLIL